MTSSLARYDAMCRAIDAAYEVDEVKDIRDKAMAMEHYQRQANNTEAERRACEIRIRAERKCGQLLREMEKAKAGRPPENRSRDKTDFRGAPTLSDRGISKSQSSRWQALAAVPEAEFEATLAGPSDTLKQSVVRGSDNGAPATIADLGVDRRRVAEWHRMADAGEGSA